jgi:uncharacterized glyoxalase superfamily protein PhnB
MNNHKHMKNQNKKAKKSKGRKTTLLKQKRIPRGFGAVTPYLVINGAANAIEFYKNAFGARKLGVATMPDGKILHARIKIGDSIVMLSDEFPGSTNTSSPTSLGGSTVTMHIYSNNVDKLWQKALEAGAKIALPIDDQFWGERYGKLLDPFGHNWSLSMQVSMGKKEREAKRHAAMKMFSQVKDPDKFE